MKKNIFLIITVCFAAIVLFLMNHNIHAQAGIGVHHQVKNIKGNAGGCFLVISDIHLNPTNNPSEAYACRDAYPPIWDSAKAEIRRLIGQRHPQFIVVLGDLCNHTDDDVSEKENEKLRNAAMQQLGSVLKDLYQIAKEYSIPIVYTPGNNDSYWHNDIFSVAKLRGYANNTRWPFIDPISPTNLWQDSVNGRGYYSCCLLVNSSDFRVIVLNSVKKNLPGEMTWLANELKNHMSDNILIVMHVPLGVDSVATKETNKKNKTNETIFFWPNKFYEDSLLDLLYLHRSHIVGVLTSHTHMAGVKKLYDDRGNKKYATVELSVPGIAPGAGNNPSMELISYNEKCQLTNAEIFYMDYDYAATTPMKGWGGTEYNFNIPPGSTLYSYFDTVANDNKWGAKMFKSVNDRYNNINHTDVYNINKR